ncbi:transmembrane protein, putative (macronuclear) [Tetrahymena thermophila SB210]|uniref:Transmembrane protein, putative n=1 Tax=Tetrahymena thermophila (strain SB210) TaxID=312017 RepID=W7XIP8_TETTS|nr:transmembrane protein, putative [Tetrahymena thermophila SB210]EWS73509.1 transmembrane protein, putative [Tetrahymena thermophila SB210]|eukprot:XP_012653991.1 transmembrane protein, putative [Tetrahymena thermophila SB210]
MQQYTHLLAYLFTYLHILYICQYLLQYILINLLVIYFALVLSKRQLITNSPLSLQLLLIFIIKQKIYLYYIYNQINHLFFEYNFQSKLRLFLIFEEKAYQLLLKIIFMIQQQIAKWMQIILYWFIYTIGKKQGINLETWWILQSQLNNYLEYFSYSAFIQFQINLIVASDLFFPFLLLISLSSFLNQDFIQYCHFFQFQSTLTNQLIFKELDIQCGDTQYNRFYTFLSIKVFLFHSQCQQNIIFCRHQISNFICFLPLSFFNHVGQTYLFHPLKQQSHSQVQSDLFCEEEF